jgi:hypothetical protein
MITNQQLRAAFLSPRMKYYFDKKLAPLSSHEVDIRIEEALKFLNLPAHVGGGIPVTSEIDEVWHYWILETREYQKLCSKIIDGRMIHHSSKEYLEYGQKEMNAADINLADGISILCSYVKNYGPFEPDRVNYWHFASVIMTLKNWNLDQLNNWLQLALEPAHSGAAQAQASACRDAGMAAE